MFRIVLLTDVYYPFMCGVTRVVDILLKELAKRGFKITLFAPAPIKEAYKIVRNGNVDLVLIHSWKLLGLYSELNPPEIVSTYYAVRRYFLGYVDEDETIIVHAHSPYITMSMLRIFGWKKGFSFPIVFTFHTLTNEYMKKRFGKISRGLIKLDSTFLINVLKRVSLVIVPTDYAKRILINQIPKAFRCLEQKFIKIPNPIDREKFTPPYKRASEFFDFIDDFNYAIWVGRISHEKNIPFLMKIFSKLPYQLIIVGRGPLLPYLRKIAPKNVHLVGFVSEEVLKSLLHFARCFVIANTFETLSLAAIEAMAQGVPIVAYHVGGYTEAIRHGENGFIFKSIDEARQYIRMLFSNDELREKMSQHAKKYAMKFHPDVVIPQHLKIYQLFCKTLKACTGS